MIRFVKVSAAALAVAAGLVAPASAETLFGTLTATYDNNPTLNAARAELRATDEGVPQARSGFRPTVGASASADYTVARTSLGDGAAPSYQLALQVQQPLFRGYRTKNTLKAAQTAVLAGRESLRNTEQDVLLDAVTAYMDVMRERAVLGLNAQNVEFLTAEVKAADDRLNVGEGTRTDVAQANARLRAAESTYAQSVASLATAAATYLQIVGREPRNLAAAAPIDRLLPRGVDAAVKAALANHPAIIGSQLNAEIAELNVKIAEGALLPTVSLNGTLSRSVNPAGNVREQNAASIEGQISIPLFTGGLTASQVREAKEQLGQRQIQVDVARAQVRAFVVTAYGQMDAARSSITAAEAQVQAAQLALEGIQEERRVGQRTTLDVLNAQQEVLNARVALVRAQHDRVVASYTVLSAIGKLSASALNLRVKSYDPVQHYEAVNDRWLDLRTPDGR